MKSNVSLSKKGKRNISILTIFSVLATDFFYCFVTPYESQSLILSGMIKIVCCFMALMILIIRKGILFIESGTRNGFDVKLVRQRKRAV